MDSKEQSLEQLFDIYGYDRDSGELMFVEEGIEAPEWQKFARDLHFGEGFDIKVVDQFDGVVVYTLG